MKRGQSISINTIIVAAIALLVLVIVSVIFMTRMGWFNKKANDCKNFQVNGCDYGRTCPQGFIMDPTKVCYTGNDIDTSNVCCVPMSN
jgi:hypothetical protein